MARAGRQPQRRKETSRSGWLTSAKKSLPLSSTTTKAGKSSTSIFNGLHAAPGTPGRRPGGCSPGPAGAGPRWSPVEPAVRGHEVAPGRALPLASMTSEHRPPELLDVGVPSGRLWSARTSRRRSRLGLGRSRVVHRVVTQVPGIGRRRLAARRSWRARCPELPPSARSATPGLTGSARAGPGSRSRPVQIDPTTSSERSSLSTVTSGRNRAVVPLQAAQEHPVRGDLGPGLARPSRHRDPDRASARAGAAGPPGRRGSKYLPPNTGADPEVAGQLQQPAAPCPGRGTRVPAPTRSWAAHQVVRRASLATLSVYSADMPPTTMASGTAGRRGAQRAQLLVQESGQPLGFSSALVSW